MRRQYRRGIKFAQQAGRQSRAPVAISDAVERSSVQLLLTERESVLDLLFAKFFRRNRRFCCKQLLPTDLIQNVHAHDLKNLLQTFLRCLSARARSQTLK